MAFLAPLVLSAQAGDMSTLSLQRVRKALSQASALTDQYEALSVMGEDVAEVLDPVLAEALLGVVEATENALAKRADARAEYGKRIFLEFVTWVFAAMRRADRVPKDVWDAAGQEAARAVGIEPGEVPPVAPDGRMPRVVAVRLIRSEARRLGIDITEGDLQDLVPADTDEIKEAGGPVNAAAQEVARVLGVSAKTTFNWRRRDAQRHDWHWAAYSDALETKRRA